MGDLELSHPHPEWPTRTDPGDRAESAASGGCAKSVESGGCAESAESGDCSESGDCPESTESGDCPECDGYHDCGPVAVVYNKETAQTLHAEVDLEVQVAVVQVAVDAEERTQTILVYVRTRPRTNLGTPPWVKSPRLERGTDPATDCFAYWPTLLSMSYAKLSSHEVVLREERCNAGRAECPLLLAGEVVHTQTDASLDPQDAIRHTQTTTKEQRCHTPQDDHATRPV
ncbi:uncharacterized protein DS421_15g514650 [Arachis hypogaea]|nr:uncharacterized protein DS421_15g514650 [Arachis hypogaea]